MPEGVPRQNEGPKLSQLEQDDPTAFKQLIEKVRGEGGKLLQGNETFAPESYTMIARYVARDAEQAGHMLTRESIAELDSARMDALMNAAVVRRAQDNTPPALYMTDSNERVIASVSSPSEAARIAKEEREADK